MPVVGGMWGKPACYFVGCMVTSTQLNGTTAVQLVSTMRLDHAPCYISPCPSPLAVVPLLTCLPAQLLFRGQRLPGLLVPMRVGVCAVQSERH